MNNDLVLDVGLAAKFKAALARHDWTEEMIDTVCNKRNKELGQFRQVLSGEAEVKPTTISGRALMFGHEFGRNKHGHIILPIVGTGLTGAEEAERIKSMRNRSDMQHDWQYVNVSDEAKLCFTSSGEDGYDKKHRLAKGEVCKIALLPCDEIADDRQRTVTNLLERGMKHYGYGEPLAGHLPGIFQLVGRELQKIDFEFISSFHKPILCPDGKRRRMNIGPAPKDNWTYPLPWVNASDICGLFDDDNTHPGKGCAIAFPVIPGIK